MASEGGQDRRGKLIGWPMHPLVWSGPGTVPAVRQPVGVVYLPQAISAPPEFRGGEAQPYRVQEGRISQDL